MWTREELKDRAKRRLKFYYWWALLVTLIVGFLVAGGAGAGSQTGSTSVNFVGNAVNGTVGGEMESLFAGMMGIAALIGLIINVFVAPVIEVGMYRFFMESRLLWRSAGVEKVFWGFTAGYTKIVWTMFVKNLILNLAIFASGIIFTIGVVMFLTTNVTLGIILLFSGLFPLTIVSLYVQYSLYLVPFILTENPEMKAMDVIRLSRDMMRGEKFNLFMLEVSFIGWYLLGLLACGIGMFLVVPYNTATVAEFYAVVRKRYEGRLNGYGIPDPEETYQGYDPSGFYNGSGGYYGGPGPNPYNGQYGNTYGDQYGNPCGGQYGNTYGNQYGNPCDGQHGNTYGDQYGNPCGGQPGDQGGYYGVPGQEYGYGENSSLPVQPEQRMEQRTEQNMEQNTEQRTEPGPPADPENRKGE